MAIIIKKFHILEKNQEEMKMREQLEPEDEELLKTNEQNDSIAKIKLGKACRNERA